MQVNSDKFIFDAELEYGHHLVVKWAGRLAGGMQYFSQEPRGLVAEITEGDSFADLRASSSTSHLLKPLSQVGAVSSSCLLEALGNLQKITGEIPPNLPSRRVVELGRRLQLEDEDIRILELLLFRLIPGPTEDFLNYLAEGQLHGENRPRYRSAELKVDNKDMPWLLEMSRAEFRRRLSQKSSLARKGLVKVSEDLSIEVPDMLRRFYLDLDSEADVRSLLLRQESLTGVLEWSDFDHLGQDREDLAAIFNGVMGGDRLTGVNILLYGPPGVGKTSLAQAVARHAGLRLLDIGETDDHGWAPSAHERLLELRLAQNLLDGDEDSVLLLDEMDDVLGDGHMNSLWFMMPVRPTGRNGSSRVWFHRLLENTPVPTIWIANDVSGIDRTVLRRMTFALELRLPPARVRTGIWSRQLAKHGVEAGEMEVRSLAEGFEVPPGVADGAIRAGRLGGGDINLVLRSVDRLSHLMGYSRMRALAPVDFDPTLIHADIDPVGLAERLVVGDSRRFSICLQGPPGTGKSTYVRYLAEQLGMDVLLRRASDLMSPWVGETEQKIAEAFRLALDAGAFLVFDEADSLLRDRRNSRFSWEVSQVNEMLTWMENHPLPFACTTNFGSLLDTASIRRFLFKIKLDFLNRDQSRLAFRRWFGRTAPLALDGVRELTPGDFEVVRRKAQVMGSEHDGEELVALLRAEVLARPGGNRVPVGFLGHGES